LAGSTLIAVLAIGATTHAQISLDRFQPAPAGDRFFGVQGGDPGGELSPRLMLLGDYAYKPLVLYRAATQKTYLLKPRGFPLGIQLADCWTVPRSDKLS